MGNLLVMEVEKRGISLVADGGGESGDCGEAGRDRWVHPGVGEDSTSLVKFLI